MSAPTKKLTIITVNLNNAAGLEKTIESVLKQTFTDYEYFVIDGGSVDASPDIIRKHESGLAWWVSEKDKGIYNAMNKGILKSSGEYCYFLNSGDYLWSADALEKVFALSNGEDIVYGNMVHGDLKRVDLGLKEVSFFDFFIGSIYHQSAFIKTALFGTVGLYNESLKVVSDWEFFIKAIFLHHCSLKYVNVDVALYEIGGLSFQSPEKNLKERQLVLEKYFNRYLKDYEDYDRFRRSDLAGVYKFMDRSKVVRTGLGSMLKISRFIRFNILRKKR